MSLIAEALKKAEAASGSPDPPAPASTPFWIYRAVLAACVAVVLLGIAHVARRSAPVNPPVAAVEIAQAAAPATPAAASVQLAIPKATTSTAKMRNHLLGIGRHSRPEPNLMLNGIMLSGDGGRLALINHQVIQPGDQIQGMRVTRVNLKSVDLQDKEGKTRRLEL